jgi:hypothetical protein
MVVGDISLAVAVMSQDLGRTSNNSLEMSKVEHI